MFKCPGKLLSSALALTALGFLISCLSTAPAAEEKSETKAEKKSEKAVGETKGRVGAPWTMWGGTPKMVQICSALNLRDSNSCRSSGENDSGW